MKEKAFNFVTNKGFVLSETHNYNNITAFIKNKDIIYINNKGLIFSSPIIMEKYFNEKTN